MIELGMRRWLPFELDGDTCRLGADSIDTGIQGSGQPNTRRWVLEVHGPTRFWERVVKVYLPNEAGPEAACELLGLDVNLAARGMEAL